MAANHLHHAELPSTPAWTSWLGIIVVMLGVLLTALHGNELMVHAVLDGEPSMEIENYKHHCPRDELREDGMTLAMCKQATFNVDSLLLSRPDWFRGFAMILMSAGTLIAFGSVFVGVGLMEYRRWAPMATAWVLGSLVVVDIVLFMAVVNATPLLRQMYLWQALTWFFIHSLLLAAVFAGMHNDRLNKTLVAPAETNGDDDHE